MRAAKFPVSLADLADAFRHLRPNQEGTEWIARVLGFEKKSSAAQSQQHSSYPPADEPAPQEEKTSSDQQPPLQKRGVERPAEESSTTLDVRRLTRPKPAIQLPRHIRKSRPLPIQLQGVSPTPTPPPLLPQRLLRAFLMDAVGDDLPDDSIDIDKAVERIARYDIHQPLPRRRRKGFRSGLQLWIDESPAMRPFRYDVEELSAAIRRIVGPGYEGEVFFDGPLSPKKESSAHNGADEMPKLRAGMNLLLLTDLGIGRPPSPRIYSHQWHSFARRAHAAGVRVVALVPYGPHRWPRELRKSVKIVHWHSGYSRPANASKEQVRLLARSLSIASQITHALLREARRHFFPDSDAGLEADFLFSTLLSASNPRAIALRKEVLLDLRAELSKQQSELQRAFDFLQDYRERVSSNFQIAFEEELVFQSLRLASGDRVKVRDNISRLVHSLVVSQGDSSLCRWVLSCLEELPDWVHELNETQYLHTAAGLRLGFNPTDINKGEFKGRNSWLLPEPTSAGVSLVGDNLTLREPPEPDEPIIEVPATNPRVVFLETTREDPTSLRFQPGKPATIKIAALPVELKTLAGATYWVEETRLSQQEAPPGVKLLLTLKADDDVVYSIAFDPTGQVLAAGGSDNRASLWEVSSGKLLRTLEGRREDTRGSNLISIDGFEDAVYSVAFDPSGQALASGGEDSTVRLWEVSSGKLLRIFEGHTNCVMSVAFDPTGRMLASGSRDKTLKLWEASSGRLLRTLEGHREPVSSVAFDPEGRTLASGSFDRTLKLWEASSGRLLRTLEAHEGVIYSVAFDPAGRTLASVSGDKTLKLWEASSGRLLRTLEGHIDDVVDVSFSMNGELLVSKSTDGTLRLWSCETWEILAVIPNPSYPGQWIPSLAFHPTLPLLASVDSKPGAVREESRLIHFWELDFDVLLGKVKPAREAVHHTTAKIVLVGDHSVGKSGLAWRLAHGGFKEQASTHGQQYWVLPQLGALRADGTECEAILWDLAGQPDYRLIHALFLDDVDLALVLFDSSDISDPLHGVEFWLRQLRGRQASGLSESDSMRPPCPTILVGAQSDRGTPALTREELEEFCRSRGISAYLSTSAKEGWGLDELIERMKELISWEDKPATVTTGTFKRVKDYVLRLKEGRGAQTLLVTPKELRRQLQQTDADWKFTDAEMMTAAGHLENYGYVKGLRMSRGEEYILLAPEVLNNLAASFVLEARRNPRGLGSLEEERLLAGEYSNLFRELEALPKKERDILLDSAALLFLEHNICFRETDPLSKRSYLVFPELINLKKPLEDEQKTEDGVAYTVSGAIENVYASLVVLLGNTQSFTRTNQWRNHARYVMGDGSICGFRQESESEGELDFVLYFGTNVGRPARILFQGLFESFLSRRNVSVFRYEPVICSNGHILNRAVVRERLRSGHTTAFCDQCGDKLALPKADEPIQLTQTERRAVEEQYWFAGQRARFERALFQLVSYVKDRRIAVPECFISYAWGEQEQERWVEHSLAADLQKAGISVVLDRWEADGTGMVVSRFVSRMAECDIIISVGTPLYFEKFENKVSSTGSVVAAEVDFIRQQLMDKVRDKETVMPILLAGEQKTSLPPLMWDKVYADFRNERAYFTTAFDLILDLYGIAHNDAAVADLRESLRESEMR